VAVLIFAITMATPLEQCKEILIGLKSDLETLHVPDFDGLPSSYRNLAESEVSE
jgi:hypothetical protein